MRQVWDPDSQYQEYSFVRQAQTFPDVLLRKHPADAANTILGIELKGWYLLAKEGEPSFRYKTSAKVCEPQDLVVIVPWALTNVLAGTPKVFIPYVESARYAAEYRNYWWQHVRNARGSRDITLAAHVSPYPRKSDRILDVPASDSGDNFGRFARTGIMDAYLAEMRDLPIRGVAAKHWLAFFQSFSDQRAESEIQSALARLQDAVHQDNEVHSSERLRSIETILKEFEKLITT